MKAQPFIGEAAVLQLAQYLATTGRPSSKICFI